MLMDGFFSKKLYAAKTGRTFVTKLNTLRCLECTSCATFLSSSLMVSMTDLLRNRILSYNGISLFFILHFKPVTISIPSLNNLSNKPCEILPTFIKTFLSRTQVICAEHAPITGKNKVKHKDIGRHISPILLLNRYFCWHKTIVMLSYFVRCKHPFRSMWAFTSFDVRSLKWWFRITSAIVLCFYSPTNTS